MFAPCGVDLMPCWEALGTRVRQWSGSGSPDSVIWLDGTATVRFSGTCAGLILIGKGTSLLERNLGHLPLGSRLWLPRGVPFGGGGNYSATLPGIV